MIDVSAKFNTLRYAMAEGTLRATADTINVVKAGKVPKGDVLEVARAAGISAAKRTADWMVFCHTLPLDWVEVKFDVKETEIIVSAEAKAIWRTGVEMEAVTAVTGALLNMYDMLKPLETDLSFSNIRLVEKTGGKSNYKEHFDPQLTAAVLVISDSTFAGTRKDNSGLIIKAILEEKGLDIKTYEILPDDEDKIRNRLVELSEPDQADLIITTGGTGFGPKDLTPEATQPILDKEAPGITEAIRRHGKDRTPYAMLSRELAGIRNKSIIINLPGSSKGAEESMQALFPGILHGFPMIWGGGHGK